MKKITQCMKSKPCTQQIRNKWLTYKTYAIEKWIRKKMQNQNKHKLK